MSSSPTRRVETSCSPHALPPHRRPARRLRDASRIALAAAASVSLVAWGSVAWAQQATGGDSSIASRPLLLLAALAGLSLLPFAFMTATSFVKISIVFSILRNALGTGQVPSGTVVTALSAMLSLYVMAPVGSEIMDALEPTLARPNQAELLSGDSAEVLLEAADQAKEPMRRFLKRNASARNRAQLYHLARDARPPADRGEVGRDDLLVLLPAFVLTELAEAFEIGFLVFVPFLVVDLVVANVLMALGMHMLSPSTVSLPFKLLLLVLTDGLFVLSRALVLGYA